MQFNVVRYREGGKLPFQETYPLSFALTYVKVKTAATGPKAI